MFTLSWYCTGIVVIRAPSFSPPLGSPKPLAQCDSFAAFHMVVPVQLSGREES